MTDAFINMSKYSYSIELSSRNPTMNLASRGGVGFHSHGGGRSMTCKSHCLKLKLPKHTMNTV